MARYGSSGVTMTDQNTVMIGQWQRSSNDTTALSLFRLVWVWLCVVTRGLLHMSYRHCPAACRALVDSCCRAPVAVCVVTWNCAPLIEEYPEKHHQQRSAARLVSWLALFFLALGLSVSTRLSPMGGMGEVGLDSITSKWVVRAVSGSA
jgi:hypothetical protein